MTVAEVRAARTPGRYSDGAGLYLRVRTNGAKQWIFLFSLAKRRREMVLGAFPAMSLAEARRAVEAARSKVREGVDPIDERGTAPQVNLSCPTFGKAAETYIEAMESSWRNAKHRAQWSMTLEKYAAKIAATPVDQVDSDAVLGCLSPIWTSKPETASRLRGRIERVLDYATVRGWRSGDNPAVWRGRLSMVLPQPAKLTRGHHAAMAWRQVPGFFAHLDTIPGSAARALSFLILTAARSGEVRKMSWAEVDFDAAIWTVPPERMKASRPHRVPLTDPAIAILEGQKKLPIPFPGARLGPLSDMALTQLVRRRQPQGERFTVHGFRSSFRDWAGDETDHPREVAEAALAHVVGDASERAYRRADALAKRRLLMEDWAAFVCST
nr:site-specific integrase [Acuticoccus kalidii]